MSKDFHLWLTWIVEGCYRDFCFLNILGVVAVLSEGCARGDQMCLQLSPAVFSILRYSSSILELFRWKGVECSPGNERSGPSRIPGGSRQCAAQGCLGIILFFPQSENIALLLGRLAPETGLESGISNSYKYRRLWIGRGTCGVTEPWVIKDCVRQEILLLRSDSIMSNCITPLGIPGAKRHCIHIGTPVSA